MAETYQTIALQVQDHIATIMLNRPDSRNALNLLMCDELSNCARRLDEDDSVRVVLVRGAGQIFCAGADLKERQGMSVAEMTARRVQAFTTYDSLERFSKPLIAVVHGAAFGSGCEIAAACDFIIAAENAQFRYPEVGWGTVGATQRLPRIVGPRLAKELLYTGRRIGADEAQRIGLVNQVCRSEDLDAVVQEMAVAIAGKAPLTVQLTKRSIDQGLTTTREGAMAIELLAIQENLRGADWRAGLAAFADAKSGNDHER